MSTAVVIYSGGMDSRTVLQLAIKENDTVFAISFNYGQRHKKELLYAENVCLELGIPHKIIDMQFMQDIASNSALTSDNVIIPEGHYEAENMKQTVVPNRNAIMFNIALAFAINEGVNSIYMGIHSGDHAIYPDCRPVFFELMDQWARLAEDDLVIRLVTPFLEGDKTTILEAGYGMGVDYSQTWTCYKGLDRPCGVCGACQERAEAFASVGKKDPLEEMYETV